MLLVLHGLLDDYDPRDQILGSPILPNFTSTCSNLLRVPSKHTTNTPINSIDDSSTLVSQSDDYTHPRKLGKGRHKYNHCDKLGHKIDRCYTLHGRPPKSTTIAQIAPPVDLFHLIHQATLIFSIRIVKTLVPLLLLHI